MEQPEREKTRNSASAEPDLTPTAYRPAGRSPPRMTGQTIYRRAAGDRDVPRPSNAGKPINPFIHARAPAKPALAASQGAPPRPHATASTCPPPKPGILSRTASTGMAAAAPPPQGAAVGLKMNPTSGTAHLARKKSGALTAATVATGEGSNGSAVGGKGVQLPASPPASHLGSNRSNPVTPPALPGPSKKTGSPRPAVLGSDQQGFGPPAAVSNRRSAAHESGRSTSILTTKPATPASSAAVNALTSQTAAHSQGELLAQRVADSHSGRKASKAAEATRQDEGRSSLLPAAPAASRSVSPAVAPGGFCGLTAPKGTVAPGKPLAQPPSAQAGRPSLSTVGTTSPAGALGRVPLQTGRVKGRKARAPGKGRGSGKAGDGDGDGSSLSHGLCPQGAAAQALASSPPNRNVFLRPHQLSVAHNTLLKQGSNVEAGIPAQSTAAAAGTASSVGKQQQPTGKQLPSPMSASTLNSGRGPPASANSTPAGRAGVGRSTAKRPAPEVSDHMSLLPRTKKAARVEAVLPAIEAPRPLRPKPVQAASGKAPAASLVAMLAADRSHQATVRAATHSTRSLQTVGTGGLAPTSVSTDVLASAGSSGRGRGGHDPLPQPQPKGRGRHGPASTARGSAGRKSGKVFASQSRTAEEYFSKSGATRKQDLAVAEAALDMPPDQLCNPLVVMGLMALSRRAAEQAMDARASSQMLLSTAAPLGLSGGDIAARHGKTPPVAAQAVEGRTGNPSRGSMVPALVGSMGRADNSPPKNPDREGTQAHILSLEAELQDERRRRQLLESTVLEVNESMQMLHANLLTARAERDMAEEQLLQGERQFEMERRAWESDAGHMGAVAARSSAHASRLHAALEGLEAQLESLEEDLIQERAVKERAMAFITQRALMAVQEDLEYTTPSRPSIPEPMPANTRHVPRDPSFHHSWAAGAATSQPGPIDSDWMNSYRRSIMKNSTPSAGEPRGPRDGRAPPRDAKYP